MSAANSLSEIKNMSEACERALIAHHAAFGGKSVYPRSAEDNTEVYSTCNFSVGPATSHRHKRPDGFWDYDLFSDCTINWELSVPRTGVIDRPTFVATYSLFAQEMTRFRLAMDPAHWAALAERMPFHKFTDLVPGPSLQGLDTARREDIATISWRTTLGIRPDAWPTDLRAYQPAA